MEIPTLETSRLIIRGPTPADFPAFAAMWADPVVTRFIGGAPLGEEDAFAKFLRLNGHWMVLGFGFWSVIEKATGTRVGEVGFLDVKRAIDPPFHGTPEVGWAFIPSAHGKGYATEAVQAALAWGEKHFGRVKMVCIIAPDNGSSIRVAERCGFLEKVRTTYKGEPTVVFERPASP